jgi:hypothetical protein
LDSLQIGLGLTAVTILSISGTFAAQIAMARRRSPILWFFYGVALGPIGPVLVWLSPPAICPVCATRTRGWLRQCEGCGVDTLRAQPGGPLSDVVAARARAISAHPAVLPLRGEAVLAQRQATDAAAARFASRVEPRVAPAQPAQPAPPQPVTTSAAGIGARRPAAPPTPATPNEPPAATATGDERVAGPTLVPGIPAAPSLSFREPVALPAPAASVAGTPLGASAPPVAKPSDGGRRWYEPEPGDRAESASAPIETPPVAPSRPPVTLPQPAASAELETAPTSLLATGVFTGGTAGLVVGARYAIVRAGPEFQVLGPLDSSPDSVVLRRPLDELDPLCVNDRCIISHRSQPTRALIAMRGIAGLTGEQLEAGLRPTPRVGVAVS